MLSFDPRAGNCRIALEIMWVGGNSFLLIFFFLVKFLWVGFSVTINLDTLPALGCWRRRIELQSKCSFSSLVFHRLESIALRWWFLSAGKSLVNSRRWLGGLCWLQAPEVLLFHGISSILGVRNSPWGLTSLSPECSGPPWAGACTETNLASTCSSSFLCQTWLSRLGPAF